MQKYIAVEDLRRAVAALPDTENGHSDTYDKETILGLIEDQPGIEIVKCWACESWEPHPRRCRLTAQFCSGNDYCSLGKRRKSHADLG